MLGFQYNMSVFRGVSYVNEQSDAPCRHGILGLAEFSLIWLMPGIKSRLSFRRERERERKKDFVYCIGVFWCIFWIIFLKHTNNTITFFGIFQMIHMIHLHHISKQAIKLNKLTRPLRFIDKYPWRLTLDIMTSPWRDAGLLAAGALGAGWELRAAIK